MTREQRDELRDAIDQAKRAWLERNGGYDTVEHTRTCAHCHNDFRSRLRAVDGRLYFCPKPATCRQNFYHEQGRIRARKTLERAFGKAAA